MDDVIQTDSQPLYRYYKYSHIVTRDPDRNHGPILPAIIATEKVPVAELKKIEGSSDANG